MQIGVKKVLSLGGVSVPMALCIFNVTSCYQTVDKECCQQLFKEALSSPPREWQCFSKDINEIPLYVGYIIIEERAL